jgi:hypothetical protein
MNNPFKTIGIALILSVVGLLSIVELPKLLSQFNQSEWLIAMAIAVLLSLSLLISILNNAQKVQQSISVKSNH